MAERGAGDGEPLTASVVEQLREKARTEEELASEREAEARSAERVERAKADEQATAMQHAGDPGRWAAARREARRAPVRRRGALGLTQLLLVVAGAALLGAMLRRG